MPYTYRNVQKNRFYPKISQNNVGQKQRGYMPNPGGGSRFGLTGFYRNESALYCAPALDTPVTALSEHLAPPGIMYKQVMCRSYVVLI